MKSILHLKDDTEYQIPLKETEEDDRAKVGADVETTVPNPEAGAKKETEAEGEAKQVKAAKKKTNEISQEEVNNENDSALDNLEEENPNQEHSNTENISNDTNTESVPQVDSAKAALDEMKKLASQEGVIHPSLFISNFSKILGLMERAMQLQVKESGSATEEKATEEKAPETTKQTETPAKDK